MNILMKRKPEVTSAKLRRGVPCDPDFNHFVSNNILGLLRLIIRMSILEIDLQNQERRTECPAWTGVLKPFPGAGFAANMFAIDLQSVRFCVE